MQDEPVLRDRVLQRTRRHETVRDLFVVRVGEDADTGAAPLRAVHRDIGLAQQRLGVGRAGEQGDADARADDDRLAVQLVRHRQRARDPLRDGRGGGDVEPGQHDGELVAAEAGDDVVVAHPRAQA